MNEATTTVERVVFCQGDDANEPLAILENDGEKAALDYLAQWHYPGEHEDAAETAAGSEDYVYDAGDGYVINYNLRLGYIGLEYTATP